MQWIEECHIGETASFLVTPAGFFRAPPQGNAIQLPSVVKGSTASATRDRVVVIQNSDGVRIGNSVSWNFTAGSKKKKSNKEKAKRKELAEEPKIKEPVENAEVPSQSRMSP